MIIDGINFIKGENNVGKSTFLWELSQTLYQLDKKLCFLGGTKDFENNYNFLKIFEYKFFSQDERVFQFIIEIQKIVDYLVIDDIDFIKTDYADILFNEFKKPIILTCNINRVYNHFNHKHINFILHNNKNIELENNTVVKTEQFLNQIKRENKIEKLLNDKG